MNDIKLRAAAWNRFITRGLGIEPELLGASHEFQFQGYQVGIHLPKEASLPFEHTDQSRAIVFSYREENGDKVPVKVAVDSVDVIVELVEDVVIPEEALQVSLNAYDLFPAEQQKRLDALASKYGAIAEKAFDLWVRILRWKSDSSAIGRPDIQDSTSGWGTYLFDPGSQKDFWAYHSPLTLRGVKTFDKVTWDEVQRTLQSGSEPPVFYELMFDGIEHMKNGDLQRAVVDMAVACEAYLRKLVVDQLPDSLNDSLKDYIDEANIRQVLTRFLREILNDKERQALRGIDSDLHKLFDLRNTILHSGRKEGLTSEECNRYLEVTRRLIAIRS